MKTNILLLLVIIFMSSCKPEFVRIKNQLEGTWELSSFQYETPEGKLITNKRLGNTITFKNNSESTGLLQTKAEKYNLTYNFGFEEFDTGFSQCDIDLENKRTLPIDGLGKVQVYFYKFNNKNSIEFYTENEYDFVNKHVDCI